MTDLTSCTDCGHHPSIERPTVLWSMTVHDGRRGYTCSPCVRSSIGSIEAGVSL